MPHVVYALRSDAIRKPGGDSTKVARYRSHLEKLGWSTHVVTSVEELCRAGGDVVHLLNLDLPLENYRYAQVARSRGIPVALSTIRHPFAGVEAMYQHGRDSFYMRTRRLGLSADRAVAIREQLKLASKRDSAAISKPLGFNRSQKRLVDSVDALLPMAEGESRAISQQFAEKHHLIETVRNGHSFEPRSAPKDATWDVVSVGRIEPRKNSLALAQAALAAGLSVLFVGAVNTKHKDYSARFSNIVSSNSSLHHVGQVTHLELPELIQSARVYVNPAWFEVVSQADVEAASLGLPVVSTQYGYIEDSLGDVTRIDPTDLVLAPARTLERAIAAASTPTMAPPRAWGLAAAELDSVYRRLLGG